MVDALVKEVRTVNQFRRLLEVFYSDSEFGMVAESLKVVYCILSSEENITRSLEYIALVSCLKKNNFFTKRELMLLLERSKEVKQIMEILKDKSINSFKRFMSCLGELNKGLVEEMISRCDKYPSLSLDNFKYFLEKRYNNYTFTKISEVDFNLPISNEINIALIEISEEDHKNESSFFDHYSLLLKQQASYSREFLNSYSDIVVENCRVVLIQGYPGSGKTFLAKRICTKWATGKSLQNFSHVMFLQLRDVEVAYAKTFDEIIQLFMGTLTRQIVDKIYERNGQGMLIILEGWDELPENRRHSSLFARLISGDVLPEAVIVITSRPSAIRSIPFNVIDRRIEILGFTEQQVQQNIKYYFQNHSNGTELVEQFCMEVKRLPLLDCFVFVPINLCVALYIFSANGYKLPETFTDMYTNLVLIQLRRCQERNSCVNPSIISLEYLPCEIEEMLLRLSKMAYDHLLKDLTLVFDEAKVEKYCFSSNNQNHEGFDGMGLLQVTNHRHFHSISKSYEFFHRTLQELLAAWYLSRQSKSYQQKQLQSLFDKAEFEMIWIFYAGLTKFANVTFKEFLPHNYKLRFKILWYKLLNWLIRSIGSKKFIRFQSICKLFDWQIAGKQYSYNLSHCISKEFQATLIAAVMEAQNPHLCKELCESYFFYDEPCYFSVPESAATPQILSALSYCIAHSSKKWIVNCKGLDSSQADYLLKYLTQSKSHLSCKCEMCIDNTRNSDNSICVLDVASSQNDIYGSLKLVQTQKNLQWLILAHCKLVDKDFVFKLSLALAENTCMKKIHLGGCGITSDGIKAIAEMLKKNKTLEWIGLSRNRETLTEKDIIMLLQTIRYHNNTVCMIFLDDTFYMSDKIKGQLQILNHTRRQQGVEKLSLSLLEAFKHHETCQYIVSKLAVTSDVNVSLSCTPCISRLLYQ